MRKILLNAVVVIGLAGLGWQGGAALGQDKKPVAKVPAEVEKLVRQLSDEDFAQREEAFKRLAKMPGVLGHLRLFLGDDNVEIRKRVQTLVDELSQKRFKALFQHLVKRKHEAPLDLMVELIYENKNRMDPADWKGVSDTVAHVQSHVERNKKMKIDFSDAVRDSLEMPLLPRGTFSLRGSEWYGKLVERQLADKVGLRWNAVICEASVDAAHCAGSIILANGKVAARSANMCFVFCDQDAAFDSICNSFVIARGRARANIVKTSIVLDASTDSSRPYFFSMKTIGLALAEGQGGVRIDTVAFGSPAAKCGLRAGDFIVLQPTQGKTVLSLERAMRRSFATLNDFVLAVRRGAGSEPIVLAFPD